MEKHFMIDIETTGIDPKTEDLLQIGILEVDFEDGFWRPRQSFEMTQFCSRQPVSEFAKEHMRDLYARCNLTQPTLPETARRHILDFFKSCGAQSPDVYLMGWNASNFDIPFLEHHGYLDPSRYVLGPDGKDIRVGDTHYRVYEIGGAISVVQNALGISDRKKLTDELGAKDMGFILPTGKQHDALYDCYLQLRILNGLIHLLRK